MVRRNTSTATPTPEAQEAAVSTDTAVAPELEAPVETEVPVETYAEGDETPAEADASGEAEVAKPEKPTEVSIDLSEFEAAVAAAVAERDSETGDVPVQFTEPVGEAFRKLEGVKGKRAAKNSLDASMKDAMNRLDIAEAKAYLDLSQGLTPASPAAKARVERVPVDPTESFVQRIVGLQLAAELAKADVPETVTEDWSTKANELLTTARTQAQEYIAFLKLPAVEEGADPHVEPEMPPFVKASVKLSQGKSAKVSSVTRVPRVPAAERAAYTGERRNVAKHVEEAFADHKPGTFLTINQIRAFVSSEYSAESPASAGAISARLFPKSGECSIEGIIPGENDKGNKGATKK